MRLFLTSILFAWLAAGLSAVIAGLTMPDAPDKEPNPLTSWHWLPKLMIILWTVVIYLFIMLFVIYEAYRKRTKEIETHERRKKIEEALGPGSFERYKARKDKGEP